MFEKFTSDNWHNFQQRYEGTYGFYRDENGKKTLAQISSVNEREVRFALPDTEGYRLRADSEQNIGFEFLPPKSAFYNTDLGAMLVTRIASRQFQRGVSQRNVHIALYKGMPYNLTVDFDTLTRIYNKAIHPAEAVDAFEKDIVVSLAISPQICLDKKAGLVFVFSDVVGKFTIKNNVYTIHLNDKSLFRTEMADAFKVMRREVTFI